MFLDLHTLHNLPDDRVSTGSLLHLTGCVTKAWDGSPEKKSFMNSVIDDLWGYVDGKNVSFNALYGKWNDLVLELEPKMKSLPAGTNVYLVFGFSFYYALWCIDGFNRRNGIPSTGSEEIAEVYEGYIQMIADNAGKSGLISEESIEKYFAAIVSDPPKANSALVRETFQRYLPC